MDTQPSAIDPPTPPLAEIIPPVPPTRLSADLEMLRARLEMSSLSVGEIESSLKGRGMSLLLLLLSLPFCVIPVPGLSLPFGIAVFFIGLRITLGQAPWLPAFVRRMSVSRDRMRPVLNACIRFTRGMEKLTRPRMQFLQNWPGMVNLIGFGITMAGLLLLLPLPIPFSNMLPAFGIVLLTAGMTERDGLLVLFGHVVTFFSWAFCIASGKLAAEVTVMVWKFAVKWWHVLFG